MLRVKQVLSLVASLLLFPDVLCWGPYTHAGFGSLYYESHQNLTLHQRDSIQEAVFVTSHAYPDAFKFSRDWMHSIEYASFQMEAAALWKKTTMKNNNDTTSSWITSMEFILADIIKAFSFGYLLHLLEDYVGHHQHGYLNPEKDHPLEFDIDTLFYSHHKQDSRPWYFMNNGINTINANKHVKDSISDFVAETSHQYAAMTKLESVGLSAQQVRAKVQHFAALVKMEKITLVANTRSYANGMVEYDVCHATNFAMANATFNRAIDWTERCLNKLEDHLFPFQVKTTRRQASLDPHNNSRVLTASKMAMTWVDEIFDEHDGTICSTRKDFLSTIGQS